MNYALEHGYSVSEVDNLTGPLIGNPKTATFRLADLVGMDVMAHVTDNLYEAVPEDESRDVSAAQPLRRLLAAGALGNKSGAGFYKKTKAGAGSEFWPLNLTSGEYEAPTKIRFESVGRVRTIEETPARLRAIFEHGQGDRAGDYLIDTTLPILAYAARRVPEIADSLRDVDNAMRWGFNAELGPFEIWDAIGVRRGVEMMRQRGIDVPEWVDAMLERGINSFYRRADKRVTGVYDQQRQAYVPVERPAGEIVLRELRGTPGELRRNDGASILDLGDGVLCLEFHSKANALDPQIIELGYGALELLERPEWNALVVGNQGQDFCLGVNVGLFAMAIAGRTVRHDRAGSQAAQDLLMAFRFAPKPVVTAPFRRVLGGGVEVALHGAKTVAAAETYMGLVEFGVGIIPAGGGCKELLRRMVAPHVAPGVDVLPHLQRVFETIAYAKVSESAAARARARLFVGHGSRRDERQRADRPCQAEALALLDEGWHAAQRNAKPIYAIGRARQGAMLTAVKQLQWGGYISEYDAHIARKLAHVLSGGDLSAPQWVSEQYILDLEREAFMSLMGEPKTHERIMYMVQNSKPLRN